MPDTLCNEAETQESGHLLTPCRPVRLGRPAVVPGEDSDVDRFGWELKSCQLPGRGTLRLFRFPSHFLVFFYLFCGRHEKAAAAVVARKERRLCCPQMRQSQTDQQPLIHHLTKSYRRLVHVQIRRTQAVNVDRHIPRRYHRCVDRRESQCRPVSC